jgi:hypothetical protein
VSNNTKEENESGQFMCNAPPTFLTHIVDYLTLGVDREICKHGVLLEYCTLARPQGARLFCSLSRALLMAHGAKSCKIQRIKNERM